MMVVMFVTVPRQLRSKIRFMDKSYLDRFEEGMRLSKNLTHSHTLTHTHTHREKERGVHHEFG